MQPPSSVSWLPLGTHYFHYENLRHFEQVTTIISINNYSGTQKKTQPLARDLFLWRRLVYSYEELLNVCISYFIRPTFQYILEYLSENSTLLTFHKIYYLKTPGEEMKKWFCVVPFSMWATTSVLAPSLSELSDSSSVAYLILWATDILGRKMSCIRYRMKFSLEFGART